MRTLLHMFRFVAWCFLLAATTINAKAQQPTAPGGNVIASLDGYTFEKGSHGIDVVREKDNTQIGVLQPTNQGIKFVPFDGVSDADKQGVARAIAHYQKARLEGAAAPGAATPPPSSPVIASTPSGDNPPAGFKASNGYVITSFTQEKSLTEIHVTQQLAAISGMSAIPGRQTVIKFDTGHKGSAVAFMALGAKVGQGGTMNNSHMDIVWIDGKTNTGTNKGTAINFSAFSGVMVAIHEYVGAGRAPSDFDSKRLERFDKAMEYKAQ